MALIGVDVGGTFTDAVALVDGRIVTAKVPTTPHDQSLGVMQAVRAVGVPTDCVERLTHGMTVATNALLERTGAKTAVVTTEGFRDLIEIARQNRPNLYDLSGRRPSPLVPRHLRFTVSERVTAHGRVLRDLDPDSVQRAIRSLDRHAVESVAVCLLFSFLHPEHERRVGGMIQDSLPRMHVALSVDVLPDIREYERLAATVVDAYLTPRVRHYLSRVGTRCQEAGLPSPDIMQSNGGTISLRSAVHHAAPLLLSGPAAGVVGAAYAASLSGYQTVVTFDMGGTSCDVALVQDAVASTAVEATVAGLPLRLPMVDVHTVSAGGGSIAWVDSGDALKVGPASAGAHPGPAAHGLGGRQATVTDANVVLGYVADGACLGGHVRIDAGLAQSAVDALARDLMMEPLDAARGIIAVANAVMERAVRRITVERGEDPREFALVACGGAGPMHACGIAQSLGMRTILIPRVAGVLSALGLVVADQRRDYVASFLRSARSLLSSDFAATVSSLRQRADRDMPGATVALTADMRYRGQSHELTVSLKSGAVAVDAAINFERTYAARYGYSMDGAEIEFVNVRLTASYPSRKPSPHTEEPPGAVTAGTRLAFFGDHWVDVPVWQRADTKPGVRVEGPAIVDFPETTCVIAPTWHGAVDTVGTLVLERSS